MDQNKPEASFFKTLKAVAWSFFGIRKHADHERETANMKPVYVVAAGLLGAALFIFTLVMVVKSVTAK